MIEAKCPRPRHLLLAVSPLFRATKPASPPAARARPHSHGRRQPLARAALTDPEHDTPALSPNAPSCRFQQLHDPQVSIAADGSVDVASSGADIGGGTYTILAQTAADALGVPFEQVRVRLGDTTVFTTCSVAVIRRTY